MDLNTINTQQTQSMFLQNLKQFITDNNIVGTAAGVSIALVTKDVIQSLVGDIIIPGIIFVLLKLNIQSLTKILPGNDKFQLTNFMKQLVSWMFVVIITFVFVKIAFEQLLGAKENTDVNHSASANIQKNVAKTVVVGGKESFYGGYNGW